MVIDYKLDFEYKMETYSVYEIRRNFGEIEKNGREEKNIVLG